MVSPTLTRLLTAVILMVGLIPASQALTRLEASVDQNPVVAGQSFILEVVADDDIDSNALDTSALLRDFAVGQTRVSRSTQIINFDAQRETRWTVMLIAREPGSTTIPALDINGVRSAPIRLTVLAADDPRVEAQNPLVYLETDLDNHSLWLGQPVKATVTLYLGADLQRGALNAPTADNALIRQLGQDRESSQIVNGRRYRTIARDYVIVPQTTGELRLQPANFEGDVLVPTGRRDLFGRAQPRPMAIQGEPIVLTVKPKPASYQGDWLAADLVTLSDNLDEQTDYPVGQPITRTLTLTAVGAVEENLAEIAVDVPDSLRLYPDKAQRQSGVQNGQLIARLEQTMAIVPSQPGQYTLPEVKVPWWNARLGRQQWATLPARTLTITGSASVPLEPAEVTQPLATPQVAVQPVVSPGLWPWATLAFALLWLVTLWWGWRRGAAPGVAPGPNLRPTTEPDLLKPLLKACQHNQVDTTLALLPQWASQREGEAISLAQIPRRYPTLAKPLQALQRSQYSARPEAWNGNALADALRALGEKSPSTDDAPLPPLNPPTRIKV